MLLNIGFKIPKSIKAGSNVNKIDLSTKTHID